MDGHVSFVRCNTRQGRIGATREAVAEIKSRRSTMAEIKNVLLAQPLQGQHLKV